MRFPPRLKWDLARVRIAQQLFGSQRRPLLLNLDLADFPTQSEVPAAADAESSVSVSLRDLQVLARVRESAAPIAWIGGDTPLHYPRIGQIARDIINLGRIVFVEADGTLLRRRIHEFKPASRLYLVLALNGLEAAHDARAQHPVNFRATIESIRTAKLSGFHICAQSTIFADTQITELRALAQFIQKLDIDGWIQKLPASPSTQPTEEKLIAARKLIPSRDWRKFSKVLTPDAPHAEFACGKVDNVRSASQPKAPTQGNQPVPTQEESARAV